MSLTGYRELAYLEHGLSSGFITVSWLSCSGFGCEFELEAQGSAGPKCRASGFRGVVLGQVALAKIRGVEWGLALSEQHQRVTLGIHGSLTPDREASPEIRAHLPPHEAQLSPKIG